MYTLRVKKRDRIQGYLECIPASKSISNRTLILNALSGGQADIDNLSMSSDTQQIIRALYTPEKTINVMNAGTAMRFLTAYFTWKGQHKILTGTSRMQQRPIGPLVEALNTLGGDIAYCQKSGFPPVEIRSFTDSGVGKITLVGGISSQYVSALMMIAPLLRKGLTIQLKEKVNSYPYIVMTASLMKRFGVPCMLHGHTIEIPAREYVPVRVVVEPDWSSAGYWFAVVALAVKAELRIGGLASNSIQGDRVVVDIMQQLGVEALFQREQGVLLRNKKSAVNFLEWDFSPCPDLVQTVLPVCALKGIAGRFYGMENLRIKETDRISALQNELGKVGAKLEERSRGTFVLHPASRVGNHSKVRISTYSDHRMAMGFVPWAAMMEIEIDDPDVVNKSYPGFWKHLAQIGFEVQSV